MLGIKSGPITVKNKKNKSRCIYRQRSSIGFGLKPYWTHISKTNMIWSWAYRQEASTYKATHPAPNGALF